MKVNSVLIASYCISMLCFLRVDRLAKFREAALKYTLVKIAIVILLLAILSVLLYALHPKGDDQVVAI